MDRIGRYKIVRELGRGAMGVVYHAIDPNIGRPVAIKTINLGTVLKPEEQERMRERLFREARSAGILSHPGIVTIYDVEQQGDLAYIAMEYVDGPTLDQLLSQPQPLPPDRMFNILSQTAVALDYAHGKGIVHRDVKPANIMIAADGTAKITDFGIAKITASEQFTMTGSIVGTPHYMSPEQVQGQSVDGRSDQFSLAVISFEMLTGEKPYTGEHLTTVVYKIVAEEPPAPHRINSSLGAGIETVLRKGLAKKPDARYENCQGFIGALEEACAANEGWQSLPRGGSANAPTLAEPALSVPMLPPPARRSRREEPATSATTERTRSQKSGFLPFLAAVLMAAALVAIVALEIKPGWLGTSSPKAEQPAAETPAQVPQKRAESSPPPPVSAPVDTPPAAQPSAAAPPPNPLPAEAKPTPMPSIVERKATIPEPPVVIAKSAPKSDASLRRPAPPPRDTTPQPLRVVTSPVGAIATLDNQADTACSTPCTLEAPPGPHSLEIHKTGYGPVRKDVEVGSSEVELPAISLQAIAGTLMLVSEPAGAKIQVDGKTYQKPTPATLTLPPGPHKITVTWGDGKQSSRVIQINQDTMLLQKFTIGQ